VSSGLLAPVIVNGLNDSGNIIIKWVRCSRIPGIEQDSWSQQYWSAPLDAQDERYEVDILNNSGLVVRTLYAVGTPSVIYTSSNQINDFGSIQASYKFNVYQTDSILGRGTYRNSTLIVANLKNLKRNSNISLSGSMNISMTATLSITRGVVTLPFILGGVPLSSAPLSGSL
jgi:hypothetical protein